MSSRSLTQNEQKELLKRWIREGNIRFLILFQGQIRFAMICEELLHIGLFFMVDGESVIIPYSSIIMPGEPGMMRSIFIKDPRTEEILVAKFIDFHDSKFNNETNKEVLSFKVVIRGDDLDRRIILLEDIIPRFPTQEEALRQEESFKMRKAELEARKARYPRLQFAMALPPSSKNVGYPPLNTTDLMILFYLCQMHGFEMGFNYPFNLLINRFLECGPQDKFFDQVPQPTTAIEQDAFRRFERKYNDFFMGNEMICNVQRCSRLSWHRVFLLQFAIAKAQKISSKCALKLSRMYYTYNEPAVVLRKCDYFVPHSSLKKLE
jgi:hypothetical protein